MERSKIPYLDIYVEDVGEGHKIYFISMDNTVIDTKHHLPWFVAFSTTPISKEKFQNVSDVVEVKDSFPLLYDETHYIYSPSTLKVNKILVRSRSKVPEVASQIMGVTSARTGMYNIRYEVRVAYDFSDTHWLLGVPAPLIFLPNKEMVAMMREVLNKISELKVMAVDIEVYSSGGGFPQKGDPILTITYSTFKLGDNIFTPDWVEKNVKVLSLPKGLRNISEYRKESRKLVSEFIRIIEQEKPNIIVTYNGSGFDFPYMEPFKSDNVSLTNTTVMITKGNKRILIPHIDLLTVRTMLGASMGLRSHAAYALDDVALEVLSQVEKYYDVAWIRESDYIKAERLLNHVVLKDYWEKDDPLFHNYVVADVYLTSIIARIWLYPLLLLSALTGIPPSIIQNMNTGQIAEYILVEHLRRLGFYPELRIRKYEYGRIESKAGNDWDEIYKKGKVYVYDYGLFGGNGKKIIELDFAQMYPSDMVANSVDPTTIFVYESGGDVSFKLNGYKITKKVTEILLLKRGSKVSKEVEELEEGEEEEPEKVGEPDKAIRLNVIHGYGPVSWLVYKLYVARKETKVLKSEANKPEFSAPDMAVKIMNNSFYGAFSKERGNLVSEIISASVFWRTQRILYDVIRFIENDLSKELGRQLKVLYGDTDSTYILIDADLDPMIIVEKVNNYINSKYGVFYRMDYESSYDMMLIPKQKGENKPSAKSYICIKDGKIAKIKGEFFKLHAPLAIKENLMDLYLEIIKSKPTTRSELRQIIRKFLEKEPVYKWFIKKSISGFVNEDDPTKLKRLNKDFHYAALYTLILHKAQGVSKLDTSEGILKFTGGYRSTKVRIDPRTVEKTQRTVIVNYLPYPIRNPKKFYIYVSDNGNEVIMHLVNIQQLTIEKSGVKEKDAIEKYYVLSYAFKPITISKDILIEKVIESIDRYVVDTLAEKLLPAIIKSINPGGEK